MIAFEQPEPEVFNVLTSASHVDTVADRYDVGTSVLSGDALGLGAGLYSVALVPFKLGLLRYAAPAEGGAA